MLSNLLLKFLLDFLKLSVLILKGLHLLNKTKIWELNVWQHLVYWLDCLACLLDYQICLLTQLLVCNNAYKLWALRQLLLVV